jgi:hypothetical protein
MRRYTESIPPAYVAWRAGTSNRVVEPACQAGNRFLGTLKGLKIRALYIRYSIKVQCSTEQGQIWYVRAHL